MLNVLFFSLGFFSYSNLVSFFAKIIPKTNDQNFTANHISHPFLGKNIRKLDQVIAENRTHANIPIIFLGNSSIEELSITYPGRYSGISNISKSLDDNDFQQYLFTAGVTDDGIGTPLPEFISFAIKIVGQGTNAAEPIRIRDLRVIALAT